MHCYLDMHAREVGQFTWDSLFTSALILINL